MPNPNSPNKVPKAHPAFKLLINFIIITFLYTNAVIFLRFAHFPVTLPSSKLAENILHIYRLFSSYITRNRDFVILAVVEDQRSQKIELIQLNTHEYFPFKRPSQSSRFLSLMHTVKLDETAQHLARWFLAQKIKARFHRLNPGKKVLGIKLALETWPGSRRTYDDLRVKRLIKYYVIYQDGE